MIESLQPGSAPGTDPDLAPVATGHLEDRICELAGHITAATCQFLILLGEFDARRGWASWDMPSCAAWLSWRCQIAGITAREHVRVAAALRQLPVIRAEFSAGRISYSKARALTRIATPDNEAELTEMASSMTANQLERFARAYQQSTARQQRAPGETPALPAKALTWRFDQETGGISFTIQLPPADGAVVLQALRAAIGDLEHPHDNPQGVSAETTRPEPLRVAAENLADALTEVAGAYLAGKIATAGNADIYQVIVHTTPEALTPGVSAGTPAPAAAGIGHPAFPGRCHIEDGPAISVATAQMIACTATLSAMLHDAAGAVLNVGRRSRTATTRIRKAVRERDGYRCTFPGCDSRRTDVHHIVYWRNGGQTSLDNLTLLCRTHHTLTHDKGYIITRQPSGRCTFTRPDGLVIPAAPALAEPGGSITDCHDAAITPATIIPPNSGERLDLHLAIWITLTNARTRDERRQRAQQAQAA